MITQARDYTDAYEHFIEQGKTTKINSYRLMSFADYIRAVKDVEEMKERVSELEAKIASRDLQE